MEDEQIQAHEEIQILKKEKIMELYIVLPEKALDMWLLRGCLPGSFIENGTDPKRAWYNLHTDIDRVRDQRLHQRQHVQLSERLPTTRITTTEAFILLDSGAHDRTTTESAIRRST
eukprot:6491968-Amphidinium_carterae.1